MQPTSNRLLENVKQEASPPAGVTLTETPPTPVAEHNGKPGSAAEPVASVPPVPPSASPRSLHWRKWVLAAAAMAGLAGTAYALLPWVEKEFKTISTDDAYVNGHVTYVAPRVSGQVSRVLVDDNQRVKKGDLLVQLDREPYLVQVQIKTATLKAAETDLAAAEAQARGLVAQGAAQRWKLQNAMEGVDNQVALLKARVATLRSAEAAQELAVADLTRSQGAYNKGAESKQVLDTYVSARKIADAKVSQALADVYQVRVALGLPSDPPNGNLEAVPDDLNQRFSSVRQALSDLIQTMAQVGLPLVGTGKTPHQVLDEFLQRAPDRDVDRLLERLVPAAPAVKQAEARLLQAKSDLALAELNLRYCDIVSDTDGVVTSRNVNPGNYVQVGQQLMAVRSVTEIWIDANFKETQLADLRIGQRVRCEVDMYSSRRVYVGRITGFTMGTGQTLSLLPPQNATGNFVKIVQRLPVRVELTDYDPDRDPLFVGLSVTPYVYYKEPPAGPHAGAVLQPVGQLPTGPASTGVVP